MEELLEAVSEAVSAMVLYAVESDEKNSKVPDILSLCFCVYVFFVNYSY
jgi:hypothetical protein